MDDLKAAVIQRLIDTTGNIIASQLSKPNFDGHRTNIEQYYKDLQPIRETLPDAPDVIPEPITAPVTHEPEYSENEERKTDKLVDEICTPDLSPEELLECREGVEELLKNPNIMQKYFQSTTTS